MRLNMSKTYIPDRGDIVWVDLSPIKGHEQGGYRTALILSKDIFNEPRRLMIICPITSKEKKHPFNVLLENQKTKGFVISDQIRTIDWPDRRIKFIEKVNDKTYQEVISKINILVEG